MVEAKVAYRAKPGPEMTGLIIALRVSIFVLDRPVFCK